MPELKPFVKWAGGKSQLLSNIRKTYPDALGEGTNKYAEPFVGGGAVLFDILSDYKLDAVFISDINAELINAYQQIKANVDEMVSLLRQYEINYWALSQEEAKDFYYTKRNRFNGLLSKESSAENIEKAAIFIFLNRTCFNGLYRVNRQGLFNVPTGRYKNPRICDEENLRNISKALQKVEIVCGDYKSSSDFIDDKTFVYLDPPYRPLNNVSSFTAYSKDGFGDKEQKELADFVHKLHQRGAKIVVSNSDPKNENREDEFFDKLYSPYTIDRVGAKRMINSRAEGRGEISELLISNF